MVKLFSAFIAIGLVLTIGVVIVHGTEPAVVKVASADADPAAVAYRASHPDGSQAAQTHRN